MNYEPDSQYVCRECEGERIIWDAFVDENNNVVGVHEFNQCMDCNAERSAALRSEIKNQEVTA